MALNRRLSLTFLALLPFSSPEPRKPVTAAGYPTYRRTLDLQATPDTSANVSIGDINGDGALDVVLVNGRHWPGMSRVFLGDGRGHFATTYDLSDTKYKSYSGILVDVNGDGAPDVILSNDTPDPKVILLNDGKGHFHLAGTFGRPEWPTRNVAIADLNGDGRPDIIVANRSSKAQQFVCLNQGRTLFDSPCTTVADYSATTITAVDINHDGHPDLVVPNRDGGQSYIYINAGDGTFPASKRMPFGPADASIRMATVADLEGDGLLDIVTIDDRRNAVEIYYGQKAGGFGGAVRLDPGLATPYALAIYDLDRDRHPDILIGYVESPSNAFFGNGGRRFTQVTFGDSLGTVYGFTVADLDRDGNLDIVAARSDARSVIYFGDAR
jgi:hypothetical protein